MCFRCDYMYGRSEDKTISGNTSGNSNPLVVPVGSGTCHNTCPAACKQAGIVAVGHPPAEVSHSLACFTSSLLTDGVQQESAVKYAAAAKVPCHFK